MKVAIMTAASTSPRADLALIGGLSLCSGFSCNNGFCRYVVNRRLAHYDVLSDRFSGLLYHTAEDGARFCGKHVMLCSLNARRLRCTLASFSYGYCLHFRFQRYTVASSGLAATA
jgi:hypothetical protein